MDFVQAQRHCASVRGCAGRRDWVTDSENVAVARARGEIRPSAASGGARWRLISSAKLLLEILRLEHRIAIHWLLGNRLDDVPVFGDLAVPDPKDLDDCNTTFAGCRRHMDMQKNERTF
jgi:hypothetical protein